MKAGAAQIIITPPVGVELSGHAFGPSVGILDDLEAQALVLEAGGEPAAILTADLIGFCPELVEAVRKRVESSLGIAPHRVLLAASHTHSGPATIFLRHWGAMDERYLSVIEDQLVGLVEMAWRTLREARAGMALGSVDNIAENRRVPNGAIDPAVPVLRFDDSTGQPIAVLYNYACHPVSLHSYRKLISPDYPGYARSVIQGVLGQDVVVLFTLGAAGDINPRGYVAGQTTPEQSRQMGAILGCEVAKIALGIESQPGVISRVERTAIDLPVEPLPSPAQLRDVRGQLEIEAARLRDEGRPSWKVAEAEIRRDWASEALRAWELGQIRDSRRCEMQGIRLGDALILALPLEVFVETGLTIKEEARKAGARVTIVSSNSNGALGYLPTQDAYDTEGDYTNPHGIAPKVYDLYAFSPGAEPLLCQQTIQLLKALYPG